MVRFCQIFEAFSEYMNFILVFFYRYELTSISRNWSFFWGFCETNVKNFISVKVSVRFQLQYPILIGIFFISIKRLIRGIEKLSLSKECIIHQFFFGKIERRNLTSKFSHNAMWNFSYFYLTFFSASLLSVS